MILFKFTDTTAAHRCQCMLHSCNGLFNGFRTPRLPADKKTTKIHTFTKLFGRKAANYRTTATNHVQIGCCCLHVPLVNGGTATSTGEYGYVTVCIALPLAGRSHAHWREVSMSPDCIIYKNVFTFILFFWVCGKANSYNSSTYTSFFWPHDLHCMSDSACLGCSGSALVWIATSNSGSEKFMIYIVWTLLPINIWHILDL